MPQCASWQHLTGVEIPQKLIESLCDRIPVNQGMGRIPLNGVDLWGYDAHVPTVCLRWRHDHPQWEPKAATVAVSSEVNQFTRSVVAQELWTLAKDGRLEVPDFPDLSKA